MYKIKFDFINRNILLIIDYYYMLILAAYFVWAETPQICPIIEKQLTLIASDDCTKYYTCDHNSPILSSCAIGLHFNPKLMVCDWPMNAKCTGTMTGLSTTCLNTEWNYRKSLNT